MKRALTYILLTLLVITVGVIGGIESGMSMEEGDTYGEQLGTVTMPFDCDGKALMHAKRGLALLHNMTYGGAQKQFVMAAEMDPNSPVGYWGQAMTIIHPLWSDPPDADEFKEGSMMVAQARKRVVNSGKAKAMVEAVGAYYDLGREGSEKDNLAAFEQGWQKAYAQYPDDPEIICLTALSMLGTASPDDKTYAKQKEAITMLKPVLAEVADHPGAHHYTIHASDYPPLASGALDVARSYGKIAPAVPHALHMPTHIFTRLGLWPDSIAMNARSADAALLHPAGDRVSLHYLHALDYQAYAYLQRGEYAKAEEVVRTMRSIEQPIQPHVASAYTLAAAPARLVLERQQWTAAASLKPQVPADYPWERFPAMEALTYFARAIGAARSGDGAAARKDIAMMDELYTAEVKKSAYWAKQVDIQRMSARAWLAYEEGDREEGLSLMRKAADLEATTEKHPVTPGEVLPARELYADMLRAAGMHKEAIDAYAAALERSPNRFNSLYGAGRSAEMLGDRETARTYYGQLLEITADDATGENLDAARKYYGKQ